MIGPDLSGLDEALSRRLPIAVCCLPSSVDPSRSWSVFLPERDGLYRSDGARFHAAPFSPERSALHVASREEHLQLVRDALEALHAGTLEKVVLSRIAALPFTGWSPADLLARLREAYPEAFVYLLSTPKEGWWIAASPERLVSGSGGHWKTVALAGTRVHIPGQEDRAWGAKEIYEQAVVTASIVHELRSAGYVVAEPGEAYTVVAGPVEHRKTDIHFRGDGDPLKAVRILHPTPAVGGLPRMEAFRWIAAHEPHDRRLYAGPVGIVDPQGESHVFVNLRCMQVVDGTVLLYAGGGITAGSDPEAEWEETGHKLQTLQRFL